MNDPEIRELLYPALPGDVLDELTIGVKIGEQTRADVVHFVDGQLHGYEIKGDGDTLKRLPLQVLCYSRVFDRVVFVVTSKHLAKAILLLMKYPWVGLAVAEKETVIGGRMAGPPAIRMLFEPTAHDHLYRQMLAALLWQSEATALLRQHGIKALTKHRCWECWRMIDKAESISTPALTAFVSACIVSRLGEKAKRKAINKLMRTRPTQPARHFPALTL